MSIVVTGATGALGRLVVDALLAEVPAGEVVAVVRDKEKAAALAARGVELRIADYDRPESLAGAFRSGDRVLLISGSEVGRRVAQHTAVIDAAKPSGTPAPTRASWCAAAGTFLYAISSPVSSDSSAAYSASDQAVSPLSS